MKAAAQAGERIFTRNYILLLAYNFAGFGGFQFLLPVLPSYVLTIGGSESQVGLINGLFTISAVAARPFLGREVDRRGKKPLLMWGTLAIVAFMASYSLAVSIALLFVLRLVHGIAWAATTTSASAMAADLAPASRRGEAMGYFGTAASVALAVAPLAAVALMGSYGFNEVFLAGAAFIAVAFLIILPIREPGPAAAFDRPAADGRGRPRSGWLDLIYRPALLPSITAFSVTLTYGALVTYLPLLAFRSSVNPGVFFTVYAIFLIMARPLGGKLADAAGRKAAIVPGIAILALGLGILAFATDMPLFMMAAACYGIGFAFVTPSLMALTVDRAEPEARGAAMGTFSSAFDLGIGLGSILLGLLLEVTSFQVMYLTSAGIAVASLVVYFIGSGPKQRLDQTGAG
ncbi:MAG TPA: MFS transporter [Dehalococcoidia bacterium]|nr:MFS transporter [Dehalococcoidia bacterium]